MKLIRAIEIEKGILYEGTYALDVIYLKFY